LRERLADLPALAEHLLLELGSAQRPIQLTPAAVDRLRRHSWPGNVRELRNVLERAAILSRGDVLDVADLRFDADGAGAEGRPGEDGNEGLTLSETEKRQIDRVLRRENGKVALAAAKLGIPKSSLYQKLKKHGIPLPKG
jgi:DNA-binding NtrC family response regulator